MSGMRWICILTMVLSMTLAACGTSQPNTGCNIAQDCQGDPGTGCQWMCLDRQCQKLCPDHCTSAADCKDAFPLNCVGHWECQSQTCTPVCDSTSCSAASDCDSLPWTEQCQGHWECQSQTCTAVCDHYPCSAASDCQNVTWPIHCKGHWECQEAVCTPVCDNPPTCTFRIDCLPDTWNADCPGYWDCQNGVCLPVCDSTYCGDGNCDPDLGESTSSCPQDCQGCSVAKDCLSHLWMHQCVGHWTCVAGNCEPVCDMTTCGDGVCNPDGGEGPNTCWPDCKQPQCSVPRDCLAQAWMINCLGHWGCDNGTCKAICEGTTCGDKKCDPDGGESPESCSPDCQKPACVIPTDCLAQTWNIYCQGHWECTNSVCTPTCDSTTCGDKICSPEGGESSTSCSVDCPSCQKPNDCLPLFWMHQCLGHWSCVATNCLAVCDNTSCGDQHCNPDGGESPQSCPADCGG